MTTEKQKAAQAAFLPERKILQGQKLEIVRFIEKFGSITPLQAINDIDIHSTKLATRIGEIERFCGVEFKHEMEKKGGKRYMRYSFATGHLAADYMVCAVEA